MLTPQQINTLKSTNVNPGRTAPVGGFNSSQNQPMNDDQFNAWSGGGGTSNPAPANPAPAPSTDGGMFSAAASQREDTANAADLKSNITGLGTDLSNRANKISDVFSGSLNKEGLETPKDVLYGGAKVAAEATGGIVDVFSRGFKALTDVISNNPVVQHIANTKGVSGALDYISGAAEQAKTEQSVGWNDPSNKNVKDFVEQHPQFIDFAKNLSKTGSNLSMIALPENVKNVTTDLAGQAGNALDSGTSAVAGEVKNIGSDIKQGVNSMLPEAKPIEAPVLNEKSVIDSYNRSIKPSVTGKNSAQDIARSNKRTLSGLKAISDNKANLEFTDADGNVIKGESPKTVAQLSDSISQTKASIYKQYDALATEAGGKGIRVNARNIAMELDPVIQNKALSISNPSAIKYAKELQSRLWQGGELDAKTAQEVIQNYNNELKAYYRNPTPGHASNVQIDAMVANKMGTMLDDGITSATGKEYQELKSQYGALKSMEKDVAKRSAAIAKQSNVGFADKFSNIASGAELVRGLMTGNPVDVGMSATIKGIQMYQKYINNPDVGVQKMFSEFDRVSPKPTAQPQLKSEEKIPSTNPTSFEPKSQTGKAIKGFVENPKLGLSVSDITKNIPSAEKGTLRDFTDYVSGSYKPKGQQLIDLKRDATEIAEKYGFTSATKGDKALANQFGQYLDSVGFDKKIVKRL